MSWAPLRSVAGFLVENHYLGPIRRGMAWKDEAGVIVISKPTSRRIPNHWLELARWCIVSDKKNAGSRQWAAFVADVRHTFPEVTTIVSYSDPTVGHTGALYRACNWWWAPTWLRLRPPPTGNGCWSSDTAKPVKDRWVFPLQRDRDRVRLLVAQDAAILKRWPWAEYREPGGVPYKQFLSAVGPLDERPPGRESLVQPEATDSGASLEDVRHAATHSNVSTTQRYSRGSSSKVEAVMKLRAASRNKSGTKKGTD